MGNFVELFAAWFHDLPDTRIATAIGALIAFVGSIVVVITTNWGGSARLRKQLCAEATRQKRQLSAETARQQQQQAHDLMKLQAQLGHDATQKNEDRKAAIRREVYTKAVEEVHAVLAFIGGLPDRPLMAGNDDEGLQAFLKANAKVWLVADREAAHLSRELTNLMGELFFKMLRGAHPLREAMKPIRDIDKQVVHFEAEAMRTDVRLAEAKERQDTPEAQAAIADSWTSTHDLVKSLRAEQARNMKELAPRRLALARKMFDEMREVQRTIVRLVSALRSELHLPPDEEQFLAQLADMEVRAMSALNKAFGIAPEDSPGSALGSVRVTGRA